MLRKIPLYIKQLFSLSFFRKNAIILTVSMAAIFISLYGVWKCSENPYLSLIFIYVCIIVIIILNIVSLRHLLLRKPTLPFLKLIKTLFFQLCYFLLFYSIYNIMALPIAGLFYISTALGGFIIYLYNISVYISLMFVNTSVILGKKVHIEDTLKKYFTFLPVGIVFNIINILLYMLFIVVMIILLDRTPEITETKNMDFKVLSLIFAVGILIFIYNALASSISASFYIHLQTLLRKERLKGDNL